MKISIIILNYGGSKETIEMLKSLQDQIDDNENNPEIIIVDNASEEADFINLKNSLVHKNPLTTSQVVYPQVKIMRNSENLGFSGGNNVGIRQALKNGSNWVVLLNNDTWAESGFIKRLKAILSVKNGIVTIPMLEGDRVAYCGKVRWLKPKLIHITTSQVVYPQIYAIGGAVAIHKDVFEKTGFLDENYFLYFEDADFSVRARKAGFDIYIAENLNIYHHVSSSTKKLGSPVLLRYHYRNALYFNLKNGPWYIKLLVWPWSWFIVSKQLVKLGMRKNAAQSKAILNGVTDFYLHRFGKIK